MAIRDTFVMDAAKVNFTNNENNPVRSWFKRMIDQAVSAGVNDGGIHIIMCLELWQCISYLYAFNSYHSVEKGTVYLTAYASNVKTRHEEYLSRHALPIAGRWYPVVIDEKFDETGIYFIASGFSGYIKNVHCDKR